MNKNTPLERDFLIFKLTSYFESIPEIEVAILYGSFATNNYNAQSDIDLSVYLKNSLTVEIKEQTISDLSILFHRPIDIVDLKSIHAPLSQEILSKGIWIKLNSLTLKESIIKKMLYEVADFLPMKMNAQKSKIKRFLNKISFYWQILAFLFSAQRTSLINLFSTSSFSNLSLSFSFSVFN